MSFIFRLFTIVLWKDFHKFHYFLQVPRGENILDWGIQVMRLHADRKSILEVDFNKYTFTSFVIP